MAKKKKSSQNIVQVDIVSDIVCPWCWLGARYFLSAANKSKHTALLTWRPYMLDPMVTRQGVPYKDYMKKKFGAGPSDKFKAMREHLKQAAPDAGISFNFDAISMRPNTLNAHRVMRWAGGQDLGTDMAEALFAAFFKDNRDVGDRDVLASLAGNVGLDSDVVSELLASDKDEKPVTDEIAFFQRIGVLGVPTFIYQGQFAIQGAQPVETHLEALEKAANLPVDQT